MRILGIKIPRIFKRERRKEERLKVFESLYVDYLQPELSLQGTGPAVSVSPEGVGFVCGAKLRKGTPLSLTLRFAPGSVKKDTIWVLARVTHCHKVKRPNRYRVGCRFEKIDPLAREQVKMFVDWLQVQKKKYLFFRWRPEEK